MTHVDCARRRPSKPCGCAAKDTGRSRSRISRCVNSWQCSNARRSVPHSAPETACFGCCSRTPGDSGAPPRSSCTPIRSFVGIANGSNAAGPVAHGGPVRAARARTPPWGDGHEEEACREFDAAIRLAPEDARYRAALARHLIDTVVNHLSRDEYPGGIAACTRAIRLAADLAAAYHSRAELHWYDGRYEEALVAPRARTRGRLAT
jgi:hypothetical protein